MYDAWYAWVTPDVEFPADIRRALNSAFGNLAARARHVDLKAVLGCAARRMGLPMLWTQCCVCPPESGLLMPGFASALASAEILWRPEVILVRKSVAVCKVMLMHRAWA